MLYLTAWGKAILIAIVIIIVAQIITGMIHLLIFVYIIASFELIKNYRSNIKNSFSSIEKINFSWMIFVLAGFSIKWSADIWLYLNGILGIPAFNFPFVPVFIC